MLSLATACVLDMATGPYQGKQTDENAPARHLLDAFDQGDMVVFDRYYCSFMLLAMLWLGGLQVCARLHPGAPGSPTGQRRPLDHLDASGQAGVDVPGAV